MNVDRARATAWTREALETIVVALLLAFAVRTFVVQTFWIPSGSMTPNLLINDRIMINKIWYGIDTAERGDIVVFEYPLNPDQDFVKRVVGLPGDTVEIKNKATYVNGERVDEPWTVHRDNWNIGFPRDTYGPVTVPPESFFVMGDNRDASEDSRYWGFVPAENLIGEAFLIYWPPWRIRLLRNPWQDQAE